MTGEISGLGLAPSKRFNPLGTTQKFEPPNPTGQKFGPASCQCVDFSGSCRGSCGLYAGLLLPMRLVRDGVGSYQGGGSRRFDASIPPQAAVIEFRVSRLRDFA
jgi:hypothetical protein